MGLRLCLSCKMGRKTLVQQALIPTLVGIGRMGQQDEKRYIQPLLWNGSPARWHYCSPLTVSQPHRSAVHTRSSPGSPVVARPLNYFLTIISAGGPSRCAAFGIHGVLYFIQTLEAMFAASVTAKNVAFFIPKTLQLRGWTSLKTTRLI